MAKYDKRSYLRDGRSPVPKSETTSHVMSSIRGKNTKPEILLRKTLWHSGARGYRLHWKKVPGRPDICYPGKKIAIFVHGCFWHRCPYCNPSIPKSNVKFWEDKFHKNIERDGRKKQQLEDEGWNVFVVWECQLKDSVLVSKLITKVKQEVTTERESCRF